MAALTVTSLPAAGLDDMPTEGQRQMTEVRRHLGHFGTQEKPADPSQSARHPHPQNPPSRELYVLVQEAAPPHNAHAVKLVRVARHHVRAPHATIVVRIHAKVLSLVFRSYLGRS
jgi:hypothetical protein